MMGSVKYCKCFTIAVAEPVDEFAVGVPAAIFHWFYDDIVAGLGRTSRIFVGQPVVAAAF